MLIGHYAPALVLARARPSVKLWWLFVAVQAVDVLWGLLILGGVEHARVVRGFTASNDLDLWDMPYSHSLVATVGWAVVAFVGWRGLRREPTRTGDAAVIAVAVASHFVADLVVHVHDLPVLGSSGRKLGLGLWNDRPAALAVEVTLFAAAALWWWWPHRAAPRARTALLCLVALTAVATLSFFIPTPPSPRTMAATGLFMYAACAAVAALADRVNRSRAPS